MTIIDRKPKTAQKKRIYKSFVEYKKNVQDRLSPEIIEIFQNQFVNLWTNKYSSERTRQLFNKAKVNLFSVFPLPAQTGTKIININSASPEKLTSILQISEPLAQKIIALRNKLGGFKDPQDLAQLPEITNLEWQEWKEQGIIITAK
ncbi:hypothetical protein CVT91_02115 [Candidatus Atribacteria bacterium HGW-Atribacteria-1]|nr:MAG: hypothetical protein CVT91_02115 [Candidatus Atribacteria bacterium HGW-Atribacteria-1]